MVPLNDREAIAKLVSSPARTKVSAPNRRLMEINLELHSEVIRELIASNRRLEKHMSALSDAVTALKAAVDANTAAVASVPSSTDAAVATGALVDATAQLTKNNATLAGDVAAPVTPTV